MAQVAVERVLRVALVDEEAFHLHSPVMLVVEHELHQDEQMEAILVEVL